MSDLSVQNALLILHYYEPQAYKNKAASSVIYRARKVVKETAEAAMQEQVGTLCTVCWGDGFHRTGTGWLSGPCEACGGSGNRSTVAPHDGKATP